ncbi:hypothetical protein [Micromonospora sp. KLBMP9576]|uniref:hypothetical protein n=1 Tax=Micromonospora sp. KLBMP9576 TaxID=3424769 RepID=UPI003D8A2449
MTYGPLPAVVASDRATADAQPPSQGRLPAEAGETEPGPEEPLAVIGVGPAGAGRAEVLARLLRLDPPMLAVPAGAWLVVRDAAVPTRAAYVPGYRQPHSYGADRLAAGPALARPPRRVELSLPRPLLKRFSLVDTPDTGVLGEAGARLLRDAAARAGAALFVIAADQAFTAVELDLLAELARTGVKVLFAVTPGAGGWDHVPNGAMTTEGTGASVGSSAVPVDPVEVAVEAHRAALLTAVPELADAPWLPLDAADDGSDLCRALVGWAADEGLRRASVAPPEPPGSRGRVSVVAEPGDWSEQLDRLARSCSRRVRHDLALEVANIHLRVVQEIVLGVGCAGLPQLLDREMEALSLLATARCDEGVRELVEEGAGRVFGTPLPAGVHGRLRTPLHWAMTAARHGEHEPDRVMLVTSTGGVAWLTGAGATDALTSYPAPARAEVLPPVAVALSGGCWQHWRSPGNHDVNAARIWAQRALREVELEVSREVSRRFEMVRLSLDGVLSDAVDHGMLLA